VDRNLITQAQQGDREAFATLARTYSDELFALAQRILRDVDRSEDALQQTLVTAWRELPKLRDPDRFEAWIRRVLVHSCYLEGRKATRWAATIRELQVEPSFVDRAELSVDDRDQLERGFQRLPPDQRAILTLHHYLGLTPLEIADTLGIPAGTARSRLHYAHRAMRAALDAVERGVAVARGPAR
jgi:RNA polymerase sigma-70 factor, ECF subfamily